ncbi:hypothetical protein K7X08_000806 [Anisodus acutangulus]|uniref:Uncharacterized protein n=1 Tax=Anisodus acutangulus TaxID=402998 RepID=A0A9Q1M3H8_9SOLA|nr:hypothetical protein K7X08_000806 [Anisodus acutangulus]
MEAVQVAEDEKDQIEESMAQMVEDVLAPPELLYPMEWDQEEELRAPSILEQNLTNITLTTLLSLTLHEREERWFFISLPTESLRVAFNIRFNPAILMHKYAMLLMPTLTEEDIQMIGGVVLMWKHEEMAIDPVVVTGQDFHLNLQVIPNAPPRYAP